MSVPGAIVVPALKRHTATVIVAHGLGDSGNSWKFLAENWRRREKFGEVRFIFPNAPAIPITMNMGLSMPGWYDLFTLNDLVRQEDEVGALRSREYFKGLIAAEAEAGIPPSRIVIGGFSQGGAISLFTGLTYPQKLGGIFGLSCYVMLQDKVRGMIAANAPNKDTPIFMGHGDKDSVVLYDWGTKSANLLEQWGHTIDFKTYPGLDHSVDERVIDYLEAYLNKQISPLGDAKPSSNSP